MNYIIIYYLIGFIGTLVENFFLEGGINVKSFITAFFVGFIWPIFPIVGVYILLLFFYEEYGNKVLIRNKRISFSGKIHKDMNRDL